MNKILKMNLPLDSKNNQETDYFLARPDKMDIFASAKVTKELHDTYSDFFQYWVLQRHIFIMGW